MQRHFFYIAFHNQPTPDAVTPAGGDDSDDDGGDDEAGGSSNANIDMEALMRRMEDIVRTGDHSSLSVKSVCKQLGREFGTKIGKKLRKQLKPRIIAVFSESAGQDEEADGGRFSIPDIDLLDAQSPDELGFAFLQMQHIPTTSANPKRRNPKRRRGMSGHPREIIQALPFFLSQNNVSNLISRSDSEGSNAEDDADGKRKKDKKKKKKEKKEKKKKDRHHGSDEENQDEEDETPKGDESDGGAGSGGDDDGGSGSEREDDYDEDAPSSKVGWLLMWWFQSHVMKDVV